MTWYGISAELEIQNLTFTIQHYLANWHNRSTARRMLKKAVQQGRRRIETGGVPSGVR
jgi:hypothetical protein